MATSYRWRLHDLSTLRKGDRHGHTYQDDASILPFVISHNVHRRHLTTSQRAAIAVEAMPMLAADRQAHSLANLRHGSESPMVSIQTIGESDELLGRSREIAAEQFSVGHASLGQPKPQCIAATAVTFYNRAGASKRLSPWWKES